MSTKQRQLLRLNDDCLSGILRHLPLRDLLRSALPLSRRFARLSYHILRTTSEPYILKITGTCTCPHRGSTLTVCINDVVASQPEELGNWSLLDLVETLILDEAFCKPSNSEPLINILNKLTRRLVNVKQLKLNCGVLHHYVGLTVDGQILRPLEQLRQSEILGLLPGVRDFRVTVESELNDGLHMSLVDKIILSLCASLMNHLEVLALTAGVFYTLAGYDDQYVKELLAHITCLKLTNYKNDFVPCNDVLLSVSDLCPNLTNFAYFCLHVDEQSGAEWTHSCVHNFACIKKLTRLRKLQLELGYEEPNHRVKVYPNVLPHVTDCELNLQARRNAPESLALVAPLSSVTRLRLSFPSGSHGTETFTGFRDLVVAERFPCLSDFVVDFGDFVGSADDLSRRQIAYDAALDFLLGNASISLKSLQLKGEAELIANSLASSEWRLASATTVEKLTLDYRWQDSYAEIERLLKALEQGLVRCLVCNVVWPERGSLDQRCLSAVLPEFCRIIRWTKAASNIQTNSVSAYPQSVVITGQKRHTEENASSFSPSNSENEFSENTFNENKFDMFWLCLETAAVQKSK